MTEIWRAFDHGKAIERSHVSTESLPDIARRHADAHRWWESERSGQDLGQAAYRDWRRRYWNTFVRWRHVEHLVGICRYREFCESSFGRLRNCDYWERDPVMTFAVLKFLHDGWENVTLLYSSPEEYPRSHLLQVLELLDINSARIEPPEWTR